MRKPCSVSLDLSEWKTLRAAAKAVTKTRGGRPNVSGLISEILRESATLKTLKASAASGGIR